ncbi:MAG: FAD-binding oxidoreductase [Dongiaceae bacterium]
MAMTDAVLTDDFKQTPYWWEAAPREPIVVQAMPASCDVAIVGAGYTGLAAALLLARAGRRVVVIEAETAGHGASSRNAGFIGRTFKTSFSTLLNEHGANYAIAVYRELQSAFDTVAGLIELEGIECGWRRCGRFVAALSPNHYDSIAKTVALKEKHLGEPFEMVPREEQHREIGSDIYHGGAVIPDLASLHPGLYHAGLLDRARRAGAQIVTGTRVTAIRRETRGFGVATSRGPIFARDVFVATNGYTDGVDPWLRRRVIPFRGYMMASEPLRAEQLDRLLPQDRTIHDWNHNLNYMRRSPDGTRILMGGFTGSSERDHARMARRLHRHYRAIFPDLEQIRISHCWSGYCAATFDLWPHLGTHDGAHYALGYCFAGVPMGSYLGCKAALRILGRPEGETVFADRAFPTMPLYRGGGWFMPLVAAWYDFQDRRHR